MGSILYNNKKSDFSALIFVVLLLSIDFLPFFNVYEIHYMQFLYFSLLNILMATYFYFNPEKISIGTTTSLKKSSILKAYLLFIIFCGLSFFGAKNTSLVITKLIELVITFCTIINFTILLKDKRHLIYKLILLVGIAVFLKCGYQIYIFKLVSDKVSLSKALLTMTGNTGNINIFAATLCIKIPFLLMGIIHFSGIKKFFLIITLFLATTFVLLTASRAAMINLFLVYLIFIIFYLKKSSGEESRFKTIIILIVPLFISIFIANSIFKKVDSIDRYVSIGNRIGQINNKDESTNLRLLFWKNAIEMTQSNPLLGIGLGNYIVESIPYETGKNADGAISTHVHNDFLEIFAETGILGGLSYLLLFVLLFIINLKRVFNKTNEETQFIAVITLLMIVVYAIDSFFNFPMFRGTMIISFCLIFALTIINEPKTEILEFNNKKNNLFLLFAVIGIITTYFTFLACKASMLETELKNDKDGDGVKGMLTADYVISKLPNYPNITSTSQSFYEFVGDYYMHEKKYDEALKYLSKAEKINPHLGVIAYKKCFIASKKGNLDSAYVYIKEGFNLRPKNLKFYQITERIAGKKGDTLEILRAHKIITEKIKSPKAWIIAINQLQILGYDRKKLTDFINQGIKEFPDDEILLKQKNNYLGVNYIKEGQKFEDQKNYTKALEAYKEMLKVDPDNRNALRRIGGIYYNLSQYKLAIASFLKVLELPDDVNSGKTEFFLGLSYLYSNDKENACKYFNLAKNKNFIEAQKLLNQNCK